MAKPFNDLRDYLNFLEKQGDLKRIKAPVSRDLEITEIADRMVKKGGPALLFENVKGYDIPVAINLYGTERRMAQSLGLNSIAEAAEKVKDVLAMAQGGPPQGMMGKLRALGDLAHLAGVRPKVVKDGPVQEIVHTGNQVDLDSIPVIQCWPMDAGRFITLPMVITKDPQTGIRNSGMYRMQVFDKQTTGMHWQTQKVATRHELIAKLQGKNRMEVAVAIGGDPATTWAASAPMPPNVEEFMLSGFLRGEAVELVKCRTVDLEVPAHADFVLEGFVVPGETRTEGPFGDHTGYYSMADEYPVFHVTAITRRKKPIYPTTIVGRPLMEDYWMGKVTERLFLPIIQAVLPEVVDMDMPAEGVFHNLVLVSIRKEYPGQAKKVMYGLWGMGLMALAKAIIVVDENVDVHNYSEVAWRVTNNLDPAADLVVVSGPVDDLDHASPTPKFGSKVGLDATAKGPGEGRVRAWPPDITMSPEIRALVDRRWKEYGL